MPGSAFIFRQISTTTGNDESGDARSFKIPLSEQCVTCPRDEAISELASSWTQFYHTCLPGRTDDIPAVFRRSADAENNNTLVASKPAYGSTGDCNKTKNVSDLTGAERLDARIKAEKWLTPKTDEWEIMSNEDDDEMESIVLRGQRPKRAKKVCAATVGSESISSIYLVDTGCGCNLVRLSKVKHLQDKFFPATPPMSFNTANGAIPADQMIRLPCPGAPEGYLDCYVLDSTTPTVMSVGAESKGFQSNFVYPNAARASPFHIDTSGFVRRYEVHGGIPYYRPSTAL